MIFCETCVNFPPPDSDKWPDDDVDRYFCLIDQPMMFCPPSSPDDDDWGFCRSRCKGYVEWVETSIKKVKRKPFVPVLVKTMKGKNDK